LKKFQKRKKIEKNWPKEYVEKMTNLREEFYSNIEKAFPSKRKEIIKIEDMKTLIFQKFPKEEMKLSSGYYDKKRQKDLLGPFL